MRAPIDANGNLADIPQEPFLNHVDGSQELAAVGALLRADEKHLVWVFTAGIANQSILFQSQGKWFLAEDMFARFESSMAIFTCQ